MSERVSTPSPRTCSGDMYDALPGRIPLSSRSSSWARAMPKSTIFVCPSVVTRMFVGETSRWTMRMRCPSGSRQAWA